MFSTDFHESRHLFVEQARSIGARIESLPIAARGPSNEELSIEIAWCGSETPQRALLHIAGTHGVEGFPGSAIQLKLLSSLAVSAPNVAIIFVNGLNPWGMAHHRRVNESNVDLNRNFHDSPTAFQGAPDGYRLINNFLNPGTLPARIDPFYLQAAYFVLRYGFSSLKQAIAGGQYEFPNGIYFGGKELQDSNRLLRDWIVRKLSSVQELFVIEVHTGLGKYGDEVLFWPLPTDHPQSKRVEAIVQRPLASDAPDKGVGFKTGGDLQSGVPKLLPHAEVSWILQEFGTYNPVSMLRVLRNENRYHHACQHPKIEHWSKKNLLSAFCPPDIDWQQRIEEYGISLASSLLAALQGG